MTTGADGALQSTLPRGIVSPGSGGYSKHTRCAYFVHAIEGHHPIIPGARGDIERALGTFALPLSTGRSARRSMREGHGGGPRLPPRRGTDAAPHRAQGHPRGRTREEKGPKRFKIRAIRYPPADPLLASRPWPCCSEILIRNY